MSLHLRVQIQFAAENVLLGINNNLKPPIFRFKITEYTAKTTRKSFRISVEAKKNIFLNTFFNLEKILVSLFS